MAEKTGKRPPELDGPDFPDELALVWRRFVELSAYRRAGFNGPERLNPSDMLAHALLLQDWPAPWEVRVLQRLDNAFIETAAEQRTKAKTPKLPSDGKRPRKR